jgi:hypothetical protein
MPMSTSTVTPKQRALALIDQLPNTATWDDVIEAFAVEEGLEDLRAGRVLVRIPMMVTGVSDLS